MDIACEQQPKKAVGNQLTDEICFKLKKKFTRDKGAHCIC